MRAIADRLTYANVVATLALVIAVGGGAAYAADTVFSTDIVDGEVKAVDIGNNQIRSNDLRNNQIRNIDVLDGSLTGDEIFEDSIKGADVDESTLGIVPDADKVDGGDLCRTGGPLSLTTSGSQVTVCTSGSLSLIARCFGPATTPPTYPTNGQLSVISSVDDSFAFGATGGDADLDADSAVRVFTVTPSGGPGDKAAGVSPLAAGNADGSQLVGSVGIRAVNSSTVSSGDGFCEFVVGATN